MTKKPQRKKRKTVRVEADTYTCQDQDGNEWHAHAGDWVIVKDKSPWRAWLMPETMTNAEYARYILDTIDAHLVDWHWRDLNAEPGEGGEYPLAPQPGDPEFRAFVIGMDDDERSWLLGAIYGRGTLPNI